MRGFLIILMMMLLPIGVSANNLTGEEANSVATQELRDALIGTWHNKYSQTDGSFQEEYLTVSEDGAFRLRFITANKMGYLVDAYAIVGIWGVAEDILFTSNLRYEYVNDVVYPAYLGDAHEFNAYQITEINESTLTYKPLAGDKLAKLEADPCDARKGTKVACVSQERIFDPDESNSGSVSSLAE